MQTLNVGAGRTDEAYKETEEKRRADLRADSQSDANFFSGPRVSPCSALVCFRFG